MNNFILRSVCNGSRPRALAAKHFFYRNALLSAMMRDRTHVRYLVAPALCGKTALAATYAEVVLQFRSTLWFNGKSACFQRDLVAGTLVEEGLRHVADGLVVIEDVPALDEASAQLLWEACASFLSHGVEVVVTATPGADPLAAHRDECLVFGAHDLVYGREDMQALRDCEPSFVPPFDRGKPADWVPGLALHGAHSYDEFLAELMSDQGSERRRATCALLALEETTVDTVRALSGVSVGDLSPDVFPFVDVHPVDGTILARGIPFEAALRSCVPYVSEEGISAAFVVALADILASQGAYERAARLLVALAPADTRATWLRDHEADVLSAPALMAAETVYRSLQPERHAQASDVRTASLVRRSLLGDRQALESLARAARKGDAPLRVRLTAASWSFLLSSGSGHADVAYGATEGVAAVGRWVPTDRLAPDTRILLAFWAHARDLDESFAHLVALDEEQGAATTEALALACALRAALAAGMRVPQAIDERARRALESGASITMEQHLLRAALAALGEAGLRPVVAPLPKPLEDDRLERALKDQIVSYSRMLVGEVPPPAPAREVGGSFPVLTVQLFGRLSVAFDGVECDLSILSRKKDRVLLALLVINAGKEVNCKAVAEKLWPRSVPAKALHNLYNSLSHVRTALTLPSGAEPYVARSQGMVCLRSDLLQSDYLELGELCRAASSKVIEPEARARTFERIEEIYRGAFMPASGADEITEAVRAAVRRQVVSSVVSAMRALSSEGAFAEVLPMARAVVEWDATCEIAYAELMRAQAACGLRMSVVETWEAYLAQVDAAGLDASPRIRSLYDSIVDGSLDVALFA
jgi:DNA-binding SARP family transcriptional activator